MGFALGAPGRSGSRESSLGGARDGAPGGNSPGAAGPGVCKRPWSEAGTQWPARGRPFWAGSLPGMEGGAEVVKWRGAERSAQEPALRRSGSASPSRALARLAVSVSRGDLEACPRKAGAARVGPWLSVLPVPRPPRDRLCPGLAGTIALRLQ